VAAKYVEIAITYYKNVLVEVPDESDDSLHIAEELVLSDHMPDDLEIVGVYDVMPTRRFDDTILMEDWKEED
jgi:hypothetical protein